MNWTQRFVRSIPGSFAGLALFGAGTAAGDTLCAAGEQPAFSCATTSGKLLSICMDDNAVIYRFGKAGHVELEYPGQSEEPKFVRTESPYPEGVETVLRFDRGTTRYTIDDEEDATTPDGSAAWITVTRGKKQLAKLDCAPGFKANWKQLDHVLPATVPADGDALGAATDPANTKPSPNAPVAAAPNAQRPMPNAQPLACAGASSLAPYPKKVAAIFRNYAETTDTLYAFAVAQLGAPLACDLRSTLDPKLPGADKPDESNFSGALRYTFKDGAQLLFAMAGPLDVSLIAPDGFPDEAAAKKALEARANFAVAKAKKAGADDLKQALSSWSDPDGKSPPAALGAGTQTQAFTDPGVDADEQTTYAELTYRGKKLVAIRTHQ